MTIESLPTADLAPVDTADFGTAEDVDLSSLIGDLAQLAQSSPDPVVLMAGKFAMYPMDDGGIMFVTDCPVGLLAMNGVKRTRIPPAMLRAVSVLMGGGSRTSALRAALFGRRKAVDGR